MRDFLWLAGFGAWVVAGLLTAVAFLTGYTYLMYLVVTALQKYIGS